MVRRLYLLKQRDEKMKTALSTSNTLVPAMELRLVRLTLRYSVITITLMLFAQILWCVLLVSSASSYEYRGGAGKWTTRTGAWNAFEGLDSDCSANTCGPGSYPWCGDMDNDGDADCFVGQAAQTITGGTGMPDVRYYKNTGRPSLMRRSPKLALTEFLYGLQCK